MDSLFISESKNLLTNKMNPLHNLKLQMGPLYLPAIMNAISKKATPFTIIYWILLPVIHVKTIFIK